ncbi:MAG: NAD-dependent epimerase/dehydratase family protein [Rufibacter sp.]
MKKVLITGGSGLIGQFLLQRLLAEGNSVVALFRETVSDFAHPNLEWVNGDILDVVLLKSLVADVQEVYHCAGFVSYSPQDSDWLQQINAEGTANIVDACLENPEVRLCHVSSIAAINRAKNDTVINEDAKWDAGVERSTYAVSKFYAEMEVWRGISEGLKAVIVNPSIVLGPADWSRSSTQLFKYVADERPFYTQGFANFVDVRDVVEAIMQLMQGGFWGERFILNGHQTSYLSFFQQVAQQFGKKVPNIKVPNWMAEIIWRVESVRGLLTRAKPLITKETARIAKQEHFYSNAKVKAATGMKFRPLEETVQWCTQELISRQTF